MVTVWLRLLKKAAILIVNTCGFIGPAREESFRELQTLAKAKLPGQVAYRCRLPHPALWYARWPSHVPGVDGILGTRRWMDIVEVIHELRKDLVAMPHLHLPETSSLGLDERGVLRASLLEAVLT